MSFTLGTALCLPIYLLIMTTTISSNVIGASAASFFTNHSVQLLLDSVIGQSVAVIGHLKSES